MLNASHILWQLRQWHSQSAMLLPVRDTAIEGLAVIISERGVHHSSLDNILNALNLMIVQLNESQQDDAVELAGILWRLTCSLSQLSQAVQYDS